MTARVNITTLSFENFHEHGTLFADIFRARRKTFIEGNKWILPETMGMEFDQYDTPLSRWIVATIEGRVVGGLRLTPTTARVMLYTYMIKDAQDGLLEGLPRDLLYDTAPVSPEIWEVTRGFVMQDAPDEAKPMIQALLLREMFRFAQGMGVKQLMCLIPTKWPKWSRRYGLKIEAAGPVLQLEVPYQVVMVDIPDPNWTGHKPGSSSNREPLLA